MTRFLVGLVFLAMSIWIPIAVSHDTEDYQELRVHGIETTGRICDAFTRINSKRGVTSYSLLVEYDVAGKKCKGSSSVNESMFNKYTSGGLFRPELIQMRYLPNDPTKIEFLESLTPIKSRKLPISVFLFFCVLGLYGILCIISGFKKFKK